MKKHFPMPQSEISELDGGGSTDRDRHSGIGTIDLPKPLPQYSTTTQALFVKAKQAIE